MHSLYLVLFLGTLYVQSAPLPTTPLSQNSNETIVGCERKVYSWDVATSETQFSLSVSVTALSSADITIHFTRDAPDDIHFQDSTCDLGVTCTAEAGSICQVTQDCTAIGLWYVIVTTDASGEEHFSLNATLSPISVVTLPVGTKDEDLYNEVGVVTGGLLMDGVSDFYVVTLPTVTETQQLVVRVNVIAGNVSAALNPTNLAGASCIAKHSRNFFEETDLIAPPCEVNSGDKWFITVTRTRDDQPYQVKAWVEELATSIAINGEPVHVSYTGERQTMISITGIDQLTDEDDLFVALENVADAGMTMFVTSKDLVPLCPIELQKEPSFCASAHGVCMVSVPPCERVNKPNWNIYLTHDWPHPSVAGEWTVRAFSKKVELEKRNDHSSIFGSLAQSERALFSVSKPKAMNDWLELDLYMTDYDKTGNGAYLSLYIYKDNTICKDNVMKACSYQNDGNTVISCTIQLDPCELDEFGDDIHFAVVSEMHNNFEFNTIHDSHFTVDFTVRNPYREPDRIQRGEIITDGLPVYQYVNWPLPLRLPLTRVYYVEPIPFGNFTFVFTPTSGNFLVKFFNIKDNRETKIGPSCACWGANTVVNDGGSGQKLYSVDNYYPYNNEEYAITFPHGLFIAVQPLSTGYSDYEYNLGYTVRGSNPTFAGLFAEGVQHKIEGMVSDEYRFYELSFHRKDLALKYMVLDLKAIPGHVHFSLFSITSGLLEAFKAGEVQNFLDDVHFSQTLAIHNNGEHVFVSDCAWDLTDDYSHWVLFVYALQDNTPWNMKFDLVRANPQRLSIGEPLNGELHSNEYHYFEVDVPQSAINENKQLIVEVYFDQRHQTGGAYAQPAIFYLYHRGPSEYTVLTGEGDCRCHDDRVTGRYNVVWVGRLCDLEAGIHTFSVRIPQQNPLPYKPKYTIKAKFVDLYQGDLAVGVPSHGEVYYGQTVHYSFTPPASLFDTNNADSKLTLTVAVPHDETVNAIVMEQNTSCSCPGTIFGSRAGNYITFEWTYCTTTASAYYLSITPRTNTYFPVKYTVSMKSDVRHPEVVPLAIVPCSDPQPDETFVYNGQYRQYRLSVTGSVSFRIQFTDVVDGSLSVFTNAEDIAVEGCADPSVRNFPENFGGTFNIDECTTGDASFNIGVHGVSTYRHDAVRYRIRACTEETAPSFQPLGTRTTGSLPAGETVRFDYSLPSSFPTTLGYMHVEAAFDQNLQFSFVGEPKVCVLCDPHPVVSLMTTNNFDEFILTCSLPENIDSYNWHIELTNNQLTDVLYNVTVSSILATATPATISNNLETTINVPSLGWAIARYTPIAYDATQVARRVDTSITVPTAGFYYFSRTSSEACAIASISTSESFCCDSVIDILIFNPTDALQSANLTVLDFVYMHYNVLNYPTEGAVVSVSVPAAVDPAVTEAYTYRVTYPAAEVPYAIFNYNFSETTRVTTRGPYYPNSCRGYSNLWIDTVGTRTSQNIDPMQPFYLTVYAQAAVTEVTFRMKQVPPIKLNVGERWTGTLTEPTPFYLDLSTFSRSGSRNVIFDVSASSSITLSTDGGAFSGTNPSIPALSGCETNQFTVINIQPSSVPFTLNFSTSYVEDTDPNFLFIPVGESSARAYPGTPTTWTFETAVPPASQLTETSSLVFSIRAGYSISPIDVSVSFGCDGGVIPQNFVCLPTKSGEFQCTMIIPRSELQPASYVVVEVNSLASEFTASFALPHPTMNIVSDQAQAYSVSIGEVLYFRWDTKILGDRVQFLSSDQCGDVRFYWVGGTPRPTRNYLPRMFSNPSPSFVDSIDLESICDPTAHYNVAAYYIVAVVLADARNAETSVGFSVLPTKPAPLPEVRPIFVNEVHTLMGRRVSDDPAAASTCPNPYVSSSISTEQCDCPVVTTQYAADEVIYQLTFDGFYPWDKSHVRVEPSEYVTSLDTRYFMSLCAAPMTVTPTTTLSDQRQLFFRVNPNGFANIPDDLDEFPVATIHTTTWRQGKIPIAFSEQPQYILFTLSEGEDQYFEIVHDESGRLDYAPSFKIIAVINGSVGYTSGVLGSFGSQTPNPRCLDKIAYPDCPESVSACDVGEEWDGFNYEENLFNRTYVKLTGVNVDSYHVVRGVAEVRFLRPYSIVNYEEDFCYEIEPDHTHVMLFNTTDRGEMTISSNEMIHHTVTYVDDPESYIFKHGCSSTCTYGSGEYYLLVRNFGDSTGHYQLSWEPQPETTTTPSPLNIGLNTFRDTCVAPRSTEWQYTKTNSDAIILAYWNPISGSNVIDTEAGLESGEEFIPICRDRTDNLYDFTISNNVDEAELYIYEITSTPTSLTPGADPTVVPLPAPGGTLSFTVDFTDEDFDGPYVKELHVSFALDNDPSSSQIADAIIWEMNSNNKICESTASLPRSYTISRCDSDPRVYYIHVPEQEKCNGGTQVFARAYWVVSSEESNPTGTDITYVPVPGEALPYKLVTTLERESFIFFRISNVRGTVESPELTIHFQSTSCCDSFIHEGTEWYNLCSLGCTGQVSIYAVQYSFVTLLPGFSQITLDLEVIQVPKQILPEDGTALNVNLADISEARTVIEAPLLPYSGHSYVFNITSGSSPVYISFVHPCTDNFEDGHWFVCLPGAECQLPVPTPYHHATYYHGENYAKLNIIVQGRNTELTARIAITPAQVCSAVDEATAPFCSAVLTGEQWSISANLDAADRAAEKLFDRLVDDFSCNAFAGTDCTCPGKVSKACEEALKSFACHETFLECNTDGFGQLTSYTTCSDVEKFCRKSFIDAVPDGYYSKYACSHNKYDGGILFVESPVPDYEERPIHFVASASHIFSIFTLALILALLTL